MSEVSKLVQKWHREARRAHDNYGPHREESEAARILCNQAYTKQACADELEAAIARDRAAHGGGDREADRHRFGDADFNRWLDDGISDAGHTVYDAVGDVQSAWQGWQAARSYSNPSYDALLIIAQSVMGALARAGFDDCDDPGEAIDLIAEGKHPNATRPAAEAVGVPDGWMRDREQVDGLANHLEQQAWRAIERGDVDCYDQAAAMAAEVLRKVLLPMLTAPPSQPEGDTARQAAGEVGS